MQTEVHIIDNVANQHHRNVANFPKALTAIYVKKPKVRGVEKMLRFFKV